MAKFSLRRFDTQARVSVAFSLASTFTFAILAGALLYRMDYSEFVIYHGPTFKLAAMGGTAMTLLLATIGFGMGANSVGQRRNDKQSLSWIGFFIGAAVLCLTLIVFYLFYARGEMAG